MDLHGSVLWSSRANSTSLRHNSPTYRVYFNDLVHLWNWAAITTISSRIFSGLGKKHYPLVFTLPFYLFPSALGNHNLLSVSIDLPVLTLHDNGIL